MVRKKLRLKDILLGVAATFLGLAVVSFYIWHQTESVTLGYDTAKLEQRVIELEKEVETLETLKSQLLSLETVERMARERLELAPPEPTQVVYEDIIQEPKKSSKKDRK